MIGFYVLCSITFFPETWGLRLVTTYAIARSISQCENVASTKFYKPNVRYVIDSSWLTAAETLRIYCGEDSKDCPDWRTLK